jgi:hypothetical protein
VQWAYPAGEEESGKSLGSAEASIVADFERSLDDIEIMRTDTEAFADYVLSRTYRNDEWFVEPTGRIEHCNINPPLRIRN